MTNKIFFDFLMVTRVNPFCSFIPNFCIVFRAFFLLFIQLIRTIIRRAIGCPATSWHLTRIHHIGRILQQFL